MGFIEQLLSMADKSNGPVSDKASNSIIDKYFDLFLDISAEIHDDVFLKGNVLLNKILPNDARSTLDLDFSCIRQSVYESEIVPKLVKFGETAIMNGLASRYDIGEMKPGHSGGISIKDASNRKVYSVDVSLHDSAMLGIVEYEFSGIYVQGSSISKILADKCLSTLSNSRFRRMKDFYDIYIILKSGLEFNVEDVVKIMCDKAGVVCVKGLLDNIPFSDEVLSKANVAWSKLVLTRAYDGSVIPVPNFMDVLTVVYSLYGDLVVTLRTVE